MVWRTKAFFSNIKWAWQRAWRGYDDLMLWNLFSHIIDNSQIAIEFMLAKGIGYPAGMKSKDEWGETLLLILAGFEAAMRIRDFEMKEGDMETFELGFDLMKAHFFDLWD